jgi:hypothetical protein
MIAEKGECFISYYLKKPKIVNPLSWWRKEGKEAVTGDLLIG